MLAGTATTMRAWWTGLFTPDHTEAWISGLTGAFGAIFGGLVVLVVTAIITALDKRKDRQQKMAAAAFAAYFKINKIYSLTVQYQTHIATGLEAARRTPGQPLCMKVRPMNRLSGPLEFSTDDHWSMMKLGGEELHHKVVTLDASFNTVADMMDRYQLMRDAAWEKFEPQEADGVAAVLVQQGPLPVKQRLELAVLDEILTSTLNIANGVVNDGFAALEILVKKGGRHLGKDLQLTLANPQGVTVTLYANTKNEAKAARTSAIQ